MSRLHLTLCLLHFLLATCPGLWASRPRWANHLQRVPRPPVEIPLTECSVIAPVGTYSRAPFYIDVLEAQIVTGRWSPPQPGKTVILPDGSIRMWEKATVGVDGWFKHPALNGGYAYFQVDSPVQRVMILEAVGHRMVYVNGEPRVGDPYESGLVRLPILLRAGRNDLLFGVARGRLKVQLIAPPALALLHTADSTLPDLIVGEKEALWGAVVVINAVPWSLGPLAIAATRGGVRRLTELAPLPPLSIRKCGFRIGGAAPKAAGKAELTLQLLQKEGKEWYPLDSAKVTLRVRRPDQSHKRTFISEIDGSVQYYAVNPARSVGKNQSGSRAEPAPALILTLHGAGVEAIGQADAYASKTWAHLVAPTNRRPYGFDWEDWGRLDALEVLHHARKRFQTDPQRTYLTGHSMGGHGTWHLGATFPDRFAAIAPSAGWISFWSYGGAWREEKPTPLQAVLMRATTPSDTLALARNYAHHGVYILHGEADDNVPVEQARTMKKHLEEFHHDWVYHEQPGAGHWWDSSDEPGVECVDWAPLFDFFARHVIPLSGNLRQVEFVTASPGVSAWCHWVGIEAQIQTLLPSKVSIRLDPQRRRFVGTTENVACLSLRVADLLSPGPLQVELDGQKIANIPWPSRGTAAIWLAREGTQWRVVSKPPPTFKNPHRYGPFKEAFRNRFLLVYGTSGTPEENAWAFAKARYDAETFWYRANGSVEMIPDKEFKPSKYPHRNVILYGNAEINQAWQWLLVNSPVQVRRGAIRIGEHELQGEDLGCLFVYPRPDSDRALVGVVAGSGMVGMRVTHRLPYFVSGVGYPDCFVLTPEALVHGTQGVCAAGFFGNDWSVSRGEFVLSETTKPPRPGDRGGFSGDGAVSRKGF